MTARYRKALSVTANEIYPLATASGSVPKARSSLPRRYDYIPADAAAQSAKHPFRNNASEHEKLRASKLFDLDLNFTKHRKQIAGLAAAINFHQRTSSALIDLDIAAHDLFRRITTQELTVQQPVTKNDLSPI